MIRSSLAVFVNDIHDNIVKQSLILPAGAVGRTLGGTPITAQNANGVVFVTAATNPVLVRANFDNARIFGIEHTFDWRPAPRWAAGTTFLPREGHAHGPAEHRRRHAGSGPRPRELHDGDRTMVDRPLHPRGRRAAPALDARPRRSPQRRRTFTNGDSQFLHQRRDGSRMGRPGH
jgi:hypothetical protein